MNTVLEREDDLRIDTIHYFERAKERGGLSKKKAQRMTELAKERGIRSENCHWSSDKNYLKRKSNDIAEAVAYNGYCFIICKETNSCITMFPLPRSFGKKKTFYYKENFYDTYDELLEYI